MKKMLMMACAGIASCTWAAHTDAPPGRYDYTAKVAAADAAGTAAAKKSDSPEAALALADRTYAYVEKALGASALADEKAELEADRKWLAAAKTERERATVEKEIRRLRRRILFRHPDLQFAKLLAVQRGIPYTRENHMVDQYLGRWSRPGPGARTTWWTSTLAAGAVRAQAWSCSRTGRPRRRRHLSSAASCRRAL